MSFAPHMLVNGRLVSLESGQMRHGVPFLQSSGLFETLRVYSGKTAFADEYARKFRKWALIMGCSEPAFLTSEFLSTEIQRLLNKNRVYQGATVQLALYPPNDQSDQWDWTMMAEALGDCGYTLNRKGLSVELFDHPKPHGTLASLPFAHTYFYDMARRFRLSSGFDNCLIVNQYQRVAEAIGANLFIFREGTLFTPSLKDDCIDTVLRDVIALEALKAGIKVSGSLSLTPKDLLMADEIMLATSANGIEWVVAYRDRRFYNDKARVITDLLNKTAFGL